MTTRALPDLESLRLLLAVARTGSLGRAAQEAGISQPSASGRIRNLERRLQVTLLARDTRGSRLTETGELVVGWAQPVLAATDELMRGVDALRADRVVTLQMAASLTVAEYLLPDWLVRWQLSHPDGLIRLRAANSADVIDLVGAAEVSIGFIETPSVPQRLASATVALDRLAVVVAPEHPWARRRSPVTAGELDGSRLLLREPGSGTRETFDLAVRAAIGRPPSVVTEFLSSAALRTAARAGGGAAVLSALAVRSDIGQGTLVEVEVAGLDLRRRLRAIWLRAAPPSGAAAELLAIARATSATKS